MVDIKGLLGSRLTAGLNSTAVTGLDECTSPNTQRDGHVDSQEVLWLPSHFVSTYCCLALLIVVLSLQSRVRFLLDWKSP